MRQRALERLESLDKLRLTLDPNRPLRRGFARVHHADGGLAVAAANLASGEAVRLVFQDGDRGAVIDGHPSTPTEAVKRPRALKTVAGQGNLF